MDKPNPPHPGKASELQGPELWLDAVRAAISKSDGPEAAERFILEQRAALQARPAVERAQADARAIGAARVARGEGKENDADLSRQQLRAESRQTKKQERITRRKAEHAKRKRADGAHRAETKQARRTHGKIHDRLRERFSRQERELEQAELLAVEALREHGIRHHFRPIVHLAFFSAYLAALDDRGLLALQVMREINVPRARAEAVCRAAFNPEPYKPRRDIRRGKRAGQALYPGRAADFGNAARCTRWLDGQRMENHPGAIRVFACFIFLWLSKSSTRRPGYSYAVRGMGRGIFQSICRSGHDSITGHADGMPGALLALKLAGAIEYNQLPEEKAREYDIRDVGPSGHAYNIYWLKASAAQKALDEFHERVAELARLPALARLLEEPALLAEQLERARPPPVEIDPASIPF